MSEITRPKPLFRVATEFNVSTQSIVDTLKAKGFKDAADRPNFKITPEMYSVLDGMYGVDKAKNQDLERTREDYEARRNSMMNQRNESVTIDSLEPMDSLEPLEEQPLVEEEIPEKEERAPEPSAKEAEPETEPLEADKATKVEEESEVDEVELIQEDIPESEPDEKPKAREIAEEEMEEDDKPQKEAEKPAQEEEPVYEIPPVTSDAPEPFKPKIIIRGKADKLKGTKVLGKASFTEGKETTLAPKKKRKRKKDQPKTDDAVVAKKSIQEEAVSKKKSKLSKSKKPGVDVENVDKKMKETLLSLKETSNVGSKRSKRRKQRKEEREEELHQQQEKMQLEAGIIEVSEFITASDLADLLDITANQVITACMSIGLMISINQRLDASTIELVAGEFGKKVKFIDAVEMIEEEIEEEDDPANLQYRAPIITVMGHVDHGKTSLLDHIRKTKVAEGEAGGITQHVGAYEVLHEGKTITFLDTPGHEAFTAMRSRGAQATDIVILVVAADDSVMPQTIEAINHAKAAGVPIVVAINKIDKPEANPERIKQQLSEYDVIVEEWGGANQSAEVSAKTGLGIDELLEKVLIEAELLDLKANPNRNASGIVLEARLDKGKGTVANVLVQNGTLSVGDVFVAGQCWGRVRAMEDEFGKRKKSAGPSAPVQLIGFNDMPQAGDKLTVTKDERTAKDIATQRQQIRREQAMRKTKHLTLDDLSRRMALGEVSELKLIIKADVDGSIEALSGTLQKLGNEEVSVNIIHTGAGGITESDVLLASASDAIIIGFQVRPSSQARKLAENEEIDIRLFSVIYDAVDEIKAALEGLLSPEIKEKVAATVEVRDVFKITKVGTIAGCIVSDGKLERNNPIRIIRDGIVIYEGKVDSLKRFKEDVREVLSGYECGVSIHNFNDIKVGDIFESYTVVEEKRTLENSGR